MGKFEAGGAYRGGAYKKKRVCQSVDDFGVTWKRGKTSSVPFECAPVLLTIPPINLTVLLRKFF